MTKALILAAGRGERLSPYTEKYPKPLTLILGEPILEHTLKILQRLG
ncbi:NTP transferase domain-containing protein, partial [Candidatus Bathyarchaeota archaeon]|nr:NTP transferase domain-containing protein [Candidatus Bathyarchaeota archaeon]